MIACSNEQILLQSNLLPIPRLQVEQARRVDRSEPQGSIGGGVHGSIPGDMELIQDHTYFLSRLPRVKC